MAIIEHDPLSVIAPIICRSRDASFCKEALDEAITKYGPPKIMNTDQGSQFTGSAWITTLTEAGVKISMPLGGCMQSLAGNRRAQAIFGQHLPYR